MRIFYRLFGDRFFIDAEHTKRITDQLLWIADRLIREPSIAKRFRMDARELLIKRHTCPEAIAAWEVARVTILGRHAAATPAAHFFRNYS